jgi:hypothetical protein
MVTQARPSACAALHGAPTRGWGPEITCLFRGGGRNSPLNSHTPGFIVTYQNGRVSFKNNSKRRLPFSPRYMIADVQLAFFPWLGPQNQAGFTGKRSGVRGRLLIEEHYKKGRLSRRVFRRRDAPGLGQVVVEYSGWQAGQSAPRKTVLRSGWYGYRLTIETLTQRRL